jgi:sulfur-carrier protein
MNLQLRFFASLREALTCSEESIEISPQVKTISQLRAHLRERGGCWAEVLADGKLIRCALNHQMVSEDTALEDGAEIAFFPPVTGG